MNNRMKISIKPQRFIFLMVLACCCIFPISTQNSFFKFSRDIYCIKNDPKGECHQWNETTTLFRFSNFYYYCFPADSYLLSSEGPILMRDLKIQDDVFSLNLETGKNQYASVKAWLHHDALSLVNFSRINVDNFESAFISSKYHNIGSYSTNGTDFKFLKDLKQGDNLISLTANGENLTVSNVSQTVEKKGLYSPFTETGTFYIFPENFNPHSYSEGMQYPMILAHSLSQIRRPQQNFNRANQFISASAYLIDPYQPTDEEEYVNPLINQMSSVLFASDWAEASGEKIAHRYDSGSNNHQQREQEKKRKTMAVLAFDSIHKDILL